MDKSAYYGSRRVADLYEAFRFQSPGGRMTHETELEHIERVFKPDSHLLELACGTGRLLRALRQKGWAVDGIDQSAEMLRAGGLTPDRDARVGDVFQLPWPENTFDGIYCFRFTNHYPDLGRIFSEAARVLRPGGGLLFDTMRWSLLGWDSARWGGRNYVRGDQQISHALTTAGFRVEFIHSLFPIGPYVLGKLPLWMAKAVLRASSVVPPSLHAVGLCYGQKVR